MRTAVLAIVLAVACSATATARDVPRGWVGMMADGPVFSPDIDFRKQFEAMREAGVETVRVAFYWDQVQPYRSFRKVPDDQYDIFEDVAGRPAAFGFLDAIVEGADDARLRLLPVVLRAPAWATKRPQVQGSPLSAEGLVAFRRFVVALVKRYSPQGVARWQIFNEPNLPGASRARSPIAAYVKLLQRVHPAVKRADPDAQIVLAGLPGFSQRALARLYRAGGGPFFDVAAVHPFRTTVERTLELLRRVRAVMDRFGDRRKSLLVTELAWPSSRGKTRRPLPYETTEQQQAELLRDGLRQLAAERRALRLAGVIWCTWLSEERDKTDAFDWAGLQRVNRRGRIVPKPAFHAFRDIVRLIS